EGWARRAPGTLWDRGGAVGVEGRDCFQAPGLAFRAFGLGPGDGAPVWCQDQAGDRITQLDPVAAGLVDVQEKRLLDGVLVRAGLDEHALVQADVSGPDYVIAGVRREGDVVQPSVAAGPVLRV